MPTPRKLTDQDIDMIVTMHEDGASFLTIAHKFNIGKSTVSRYLRERNADIDRSRTHEATVARVRKIQAERVELAEQLMQDVALIRDRIWSEYKYHMSTPAGAVEVVSDEPPLREQADGLRAIPALVRAIDDLTAGVDEGESIGESKAAITQLMDNLAKVVAKKRDAK